VSLDWILLGLRVLSTLILYSFLGVAFFVIWRDLRVTESQRISVDSATTDQLRVIIAGDESLAVGMALPLQPVTLLGRAPENTIVLADDSISVRHARLSRRNGAWWLEDLGGQGGTVLNRLVLSKPTAVVHGDIIEVGSFCFRLETTATGAAAR
jgi:pSer/pThr/pTyr-binding forkhead associated (FHA) protein